MGQKNEVTGWCPTAAWDPAHKLLGYDRRVYLCRTFGYKAASYRPAENYSCVRQKQFPLLLRSFELNVEPVNPLPGVGVIGSSFSAVALS